MSDLFDSATMGPKPLANVAPAAVLEVAPARPAEAEGGPPEKQGQEDLSDPLGDTGMSLADVIEETRVVQQRQAMSLPAMFEGDPEKAKRSMLAWIEALTTLQRAAIANTRPLDWVAMKADGDAPAVVFPRKGACLQFQRFFGISITNPRNIDTGKPECRMTEIEVPVMKWSDTEKRKVQVGIEKGYRAELWVDAHSDRLGDAVTAIRGVRSSGEDFIGRSGNLADLQESASTSARNKATRLLAGIVSIQASDVAAIMGLSEEKFLERCSRGAGFGSAAQRKAAQKQAGGDQAGPASSHAGDFWAHVVASFEGNEEAAWNCISGLASFTDEKGKRVAPQSYERLAASNGWYRRTVAAWNKEYPDHAFKGGE